MTIEAICIGALVSGFAFGLPLLFSRMRISDLERTIANERARKAEKEAEARFYGECPACGSWGSTKTFCGDGQRPTDRASCKEKGDHLHRECKTCGRRWVTPAARDA